GAKALIGLRVYATELFRLYQPPLIDQAIGRDRVAVGRHVHVAHDVAAARDRPALERFRLRIEAHDGVRLGGGLVVPQRSFGEDDAVGLRLWTARRQPLLVLAGCEVQPRQIAPREI